MAIRKKINTGKKVRRIARNVVGQVPASRVEVPKPERKPKHKKQAEQRDLE